MGTMSINDIQITSLQRIENVGGDILHALKHDDEGYAGFGEVYFSWIKCDAVKAWKRHTRMTMNLVVPLGQVRFVFYQNHAQYLIKEIGEYHYNRITVPPGIWFGFKGLITPQSLVMNIANFPHESNEVERLQKSDFDYSWD